MGQNLRILLLITHLGGGGAEKVTALLACGLPKEKYDVHLGLVTQKNEGIEALPPSVKVYALGARRVRGGALPLLALVHSLRPDIVLSGVAHLNFLVLLLRPLFPRKTHVVVRQNATVSSVLAFGGLPWYTGHLYRLLYPYADRIICQSRAMADDLARELRIEREQIAVLPNPVDFEGIFEATSRAKEEPAHWDGPGPHLLAVGRLAPEKGFDLLLQAVATVRHRFPQADLIIAGAGPEEEALKALRSSLGLDEAVRLPGYVRRPYVFYTGASAFVLASRHEGMPNALLEAMAGGLPIVATPASGGIVDLLHNRPGAWLADDVSAPSLAAALLQALEEITPGQRHLDSSPPAGRP